MSKPHSPRKPRLSERYSIGQLSAMVALAVAVLYVVVVASTAPSVRVLHIVDWFALQGFRFLKSWGLYFGHAEFVIVFVFGTVQWFTIAFAWTWMVMSLRKGMGRRVREAV